MYLYVKNHRRAPIRRSLVASLGFMAAGGIILGWVLWPIISFHLFTSAFLSSIVSPLAVSGTVSSDLVYAQSTASNARDSTNANVWFPLKPQKKVTTKVSAYTLSIPKLRISNALVVIGGYDLNDELVHYGGTALPGQNGNAAIFGHSVLPQFFNPKNYKTIFSTLPTLMTGDDIFLKYDEITYRYKVQDMTVTSPEDLSMLDQPVDDSYITLVTCVPPGTLWERLHVRAKLARI